jgi:nitroreductase
VDTFLAIVSKREVRGYRDEPVAEAIVRRIIDAGRLAGSSRNRQPWRFFILDDPDLKKRVAESVYAPANVSGAALVIVVCVSGKGPVAFDAGRAVQNMMLAAWNDGVASCPNGMPDPDATGALLGLAQDERPQTVLSFGFPGRGYDPQKRPAEEWIKKAKRKPFVETAQKL